MYEYGFILVSVIGYLILSQKNISSIYFRIFFTYQTLRCKEYDSFNNILENSLLENTKYYLKIKKGLLFILEDQTNILLNVIIYDIEELPNEVQKQIQKDYELIRNLIINKNINSQKQIYLQIGRATQKNTFVFSFSPKLISFIINFYSRKIYF